MNNPHGIRLSALARAVVHDGHSGLNGVDQHLRIRAGLSMTRHDEQVHAADRIIGTHQLELFRFRVAHVRPLNFRT